MLVNLTAEDNMDWLGQGQVCCVSILGTRMTYLNHPVPHDTHNTLNVWLSRLSAFCPHVLYAAVFSTCQSSAWTQPSWQHGLCVQCFHEPGRTVGLYLWFVVHCTLGTEVGENYFFRDCPSCQSAGVESKEHLKEELLSVVFLFFHQFSQFVQRGDVSVKERANEALQTKTLAALAWCYAWMSD